MPALNKPARTTWDWIHWYEGCHRQPLPASLRQPTVVTILAEYTDDSGMLVCDIGHQYGVRLYKQPRHLMWTGTVETKEINHG